jgi:hypothetical protein
VEKHEMISYEELFNMYVMDDFSLVNEPIFGKYFCLTPAKYINNLQRIEFSDLKHHAIPLRQFYHDVIFQTKIEMWKNMK